LRNRERKFVMDYETDDTNQRVWNLPSRDPVFCDLVEHPAALALVRATIGWPALLSNISANITGPGGGEMVMHADQLFMPQPWSGVQGVNIMWCVDDFREDNGATRMVPRSHTRNRTPTDDEQTTETVAIEAPAGTMVAMDGRVWHKTGHNRTEHERRAGVFAFYTPPIYRTQENWFLALDPSIRQFGSDDLLVLFGYRTVGLGLVNGASPS
jgi:ectoine hydroxylase-related dioxygenase (phytanoyl-CoA dioxygenase family)